MHDSNLSDCIKFNKDRLKIKAINSKVLNRRKVKLMEMLNQGDEYFQEESIKQRDPILYEIYVGSHKKKHRISGLNDNHTDALSSLLFHKIEKESHEENLAKQIKREFDKYGEEEIDSLYKEVYDLNVNNKLEDEEDELIRLMAIRFLMGEDKDFFNYEEVDSNEQYDDIEQINRDNEDAYFDEEESNEIQSSYYTGELDY